MTDGVQVEVQGVEVLQRGLRMLPERARKEMFHAFTGASRALVQAVRNRAPAKTGKLRNEVKSEVSETRDKGGVWFKVFVDSEGWYGRLLEHGVNSNRGEYRVWQERANSRAGRFGVMRKRFRIKKRTMYLAPRPFFAPAWESMRPRVEAAAAEAMRRATEER